MTLYKLFNKLDAVLTGIEERVVYFLLAAMLTIVFVGVFNRFLIQLPMPWSEELARYLMIWAAFVGASLGVKRAVHISIDALVLVLPAGAQRLIALLANMASCILCAWFFYIGIEFIGRMINTGQLSPAMRIPIYIAYSAVPCGFMLMAIRYFLKCVYCLDKVNGKSSNGGVLSKEGNEAILRSEK